jgi:methionine aminotransferase
MDIVSKLPDVGVTIFTEMTQLAIDHSAINLSQGFPNFEPHPDLKELVSRYMREGFNQYAPMQGVQGLRDQIAEKVASLYGAEYDPAGEITVTAGATEAVFAAITAVVQTGDEVVVVEPAYDAYVPAIRLCGGIPVYSKLEYPDYRINWDELAEKVGPRTRLLIINSPHNPTGAVLSGEDMRRLAGLVEQWGMWILSDEVYEHIVFDNHRHESVARYPELAERSFVISSFGKTYHTTGWKVGYCLAPLPLTREFQKIHQYLTFAANTPVQYAYADFMQRRNIYMELAQFYQRKRDLFLAALGSSGFKPLPCRGTYFMMLDYRAVSDLPDTEFAKKLVVDHGVAAIPPSVFYHSRDDHRVLRFCFAKTDEMLQEAGKRLSRL